MAAKLLANNEQARRLERIDEDLDRAIRVCVSSRLVVAQALIRAQIREDAIWDDRADNVVELDSWRADRDAALAQP